MGLLFRITAVAASLRPYEDYLLGGLFLTIGSYAYIEGQSWGFAAGTWPRLTAGIVVVLSTMVLLQNYLPQSLQSLIADGDTMFSRRQKQAATAVSEPEATVDTDDTVDDDGQAVSQALVTALFTVGYALAGYLVGFLWATPLFIYTYANWNGTTTPKSVALAAVGFGIAYGFAIVLGVPIDIGVLTEVIVS